MKYKIFYSDSLPEGVGGRCKYPPLPKWGTCEVVIRPMYEGDVGLLEHELEHVRQYERSVLHTLRLWLSDSYKYQCELEAYSKQAKAYEYVRKEQYMWMAEAISAKYGLEISKEEALEKLWALSGKM